MIDGVQQIVNPIQILETRPTISFNTIMHSADSAMSASPNSFEETNFHSPQFQSAGEFTSDYGRIGPKIHGNYLIKNSSNALFISIQTPAGTTLPPLELPADSMISISSICCRKPWSSKVGRCAFLDLSRPAVHLVTFSNDTGGTLSAGTYAYKFTFVDENGFEGRPSLPTASFTVSTANQIAGQTAIRLNSLPPATGDFVARRIYRTDDLVAGTYRLVAQLNSSDTVFTDRGTLIGDILQRDPPPVDLVTLTVQTRGSLAAGTYNYRVVFVDAAGKEGASSDPTANIIIPGAPNGGGIRLDNLPVARGEFVSRRIYRSRDGGVSPYELVAEIDAASDSYLDDGFTLGGQFDTRHLWRRAASSPCPTGD